MKNYYSILGVSKEADEVVIRAAYKALAQKYHPDKAPSELKSDYSFRMAEINEAYAFLGLDTKRKAYDDEFHAHQNVKEASKKEYPQKKGSKQPKSKFGSLEGVFFMGFAILGLWALLAILFLF
jgi:DnaJ-class molecular chaperone